MVTLGGPGFQLGFNWVPCSGGIDSEIFANSFMDIIISTHLVHR